MEELREYKVYKHTTPNNKVYIGITRMDVNKRWQNGLGYSHNPHFKRAIKKYGWENIKHEVLFENLTKHEASDKERELIAQYDTTNINKGYNLDYGGCYCDRLTPELKKKISEAHKGKAREKTKEQIETLVSNIKKLWSQEEYREKEIRRIKKENSRKVKCVETGKIYNSMREASKDTGANSHYIGVCCRENRTSGGYHWKYADHSKAYTPKKNNLGKKVAQYNHKGELLGIYKSMSEAEKATGETRPTIKRSAENRKKYIMKNKYIWKYL